MAGCMDKALTCITTNDVSDSVKVLISEVCVLVCISPIRNLAHITCVLHENLFWDFFVCMLHAC